MKKTIFETSFENDENWHHRCKVLPVGGQGQSYETEVGNIFVPAEFDVFAFKHGAPVPHDPHNTDGYAQPEGHHISQFDYRVRNGNVAWMFFGFYRIVDGALVKRIRIEEAGTLHVEYYAHAWSSTEDDPHCSTGVGCEGFVARRCAGLTDEQQNAWFGIGVDVTGGDDPLADTVVYNDGLHIYNEYAKVEFDIDVEPCNATVFLRANALWRFKHNDFYIDDVRVELITDDEPPQIECRGKPREQYERTYVLLHPGADESWVNALEDAWQTYRFTIGGSADDAGIGDLDYRRVIASQPHEWNGDLQTFFEQHYPGVDYDGVDVDTPQQFASVVVELLRGEDIPPPAWKPKNYVPRGTKLSYHGIGDAGLISDDPNDPTPYRKVVAAGVTPPSVKLVEAVGAAEWLKTDYVRTNGEFVEALSPTTPVVGRFINVNGVSVETFNAQEEVIQQATDRMNTLRPMFDEYPYVDYWEFANEQDPPGTDGQKKFAMFVIECCKIASEWGVKLACFSHSTGVPERDEWDAVATTGVFEVMAAGGHALSLHEYDTVQPPPDGEIGVHLCRYRYVYQRHILPRRLDIPLFITEYAPVAWNSEMEGWTPEQLWQHAVLYDKAVRSDPYVAGVHIFTVGGYSSWEPFHERYLQTYDWWVDYTISEWVVENGNVSPPPAEPQPFSPVSSVDYPDAWWYCAQYFDPETHPALDLNLDKPPHGDVEAGMPVFAMLDGVVYYRTDNWGNGISMLVVKHQWRGQDLYIQYAHVDHSLRIGDKVHGGQPLGVFETGNFPAHLHLAMSWKPFTREYIGFDFIDPRLMLIEMLGQERTDKLLNRGDSPQPVPKNVRGVHSAISTSPTDTIDQIISRLQNLGVKYYKLLHDGNEQNLNLVRALVAADIQPVVRLYTPRQGANRNGLIVNVPENVKALIGAFGSKPALIETANELNLPNEWPQDEYNRVDWHDINTINSVGQSLAQDFSQLIAWGAYPLFPAFAPTDRGGTNHLYSGYNWSVLVFDSLLQQQPAALTWLQNGKLLVATHSAAFARPFSFNPYQGERVDDMCLLGYRPLAYHIEHKTGTSPRIVFTEGGVYSPQHIFELGWSSSPDEVRYLDAGSQTGTVFYNNATWGDTVKSAFEFLARTNEVEGVCMWHFSDVGSAAEWKGAGWYTENWQPRSPVIALR